MLLAEIKLALVRVTYDTSLLGRETALDLGDSTIEELSSKLMSEIIWLVAPVSMIHSL